MNASYQGDINTEQNMKTIGFAKVAQCKKRMTGTGQTRVRNWKGSNILLLHWRRGKDKPDKYVFVQRGVE